MKHHDWSPLKNEFLKRERSVCFEDIVTALREGRLLDTVDHPNQRDYTGQKIYIIDIDKYAFLVPFLEDKEKIFLKTIYPSRKFTKAYIKRSKL